MNDTATETVTAETYAAWKVTHDDAPLVIMVPDFEDKCGTKKIPREVDTMYQHGGVWWCIAFKGEYLHPLLLSTTGSHPYTVTDAVPATADDSGPCAACRADAERKVEENKAIQVAEFGTAEALRIQRADARIQGREDGYHDATEEDVNGTPIPEEPTVPPSYADVAEYYASGHEDGVQQYAADQT